MCLLQVDRRRDARHAAAIGAGREPGVDGGRGVQLAPKKLKRRKVCFIVYIYIYVLCVLYLFVS